MTVSSFYSVFVTEDISKKMEFFALTDSMKLLHHFEGDVFDYYVFADNSGNNTDFIQFKNKTVKDAFYALRINTDDFDKMAAIIGENGYSLETATIENEKIKFGIFVSKNGEPNILLVMHKK